MSTPSRSRSITLFWRFHRWIFEISNGRIGSTLMGHKVLKLTTIGRHSGKPRVILIYYFPYQASYLIVASNLGSEQHPAWYLNLLGNPAAEIQIGQERINVEARTAAGEEHERVWSEIVKADDRYIDYQYQTKRQFPLVILDPINQASS